MRKTMLFTTLTLVTVLGAAAAQATEICKPYDEAQWMSQDAIIRKAAEMGYDVRKVKKEDGCWEVKGMKDGKRVEAYFDPVTAEVVLTK